MKNFSTIFKTTFLSFAFLMLSCSQDQELITSSFKSNSVSSSKLTRLAPNLQHGKLIIQNNTPFEFFDNNYSADNNCQLMVFGQSDHFFSLPIKINANSGLVVINFQTPFTGNFAIVNNQKWFVFYSSMSGIANGMTSGNANDYHRFIDANGEKCCKWYGIKTSGKGTGLFSNVEVGFAFRCNPITGNIDCLNDQDIDYDNDNVNDFIFHHDCLVDADGNTIITLSLTWR